MASKTRKDSQAAEALFAEMLMELQKNIEFPEMLMVGTAGNPLTHFKQPGLDNPDLFIKYRLTTLDFDAKWRPDIVGDITTPKEWWDGNPYDLVHITQVIEHIPNLWAVSGALKEIISNNGYIILDCPFGPNSPPYHAEWPSFGDFWRISEDGIKVLFEEDFNIVKIIATDANTSCLLKAKT